MAITTSKESYIPTGTEGVTAFSIQADSALYSVLTKNIYSDTISAPIRELSTNAVDACLEADLPVKFDVHIPTLEEQFFAVRDYGPGLHKDDILGLFTTIGASTKRDSNKFNGQFGLGRLSPLAYASSFTVESYHNNTYHSFLISIQDGVPVAIHLATTESTSEPSGLRLSLNVAPQDIRVFQAKAIHIYKYFDTKPNLNIPLDIELPEPIIEGDDWYMVDSFGGGNKLLMGNVCYRIPSDNQIDFHGARSCTILAEIGDVSINPGRESLSLDKTTIAFLNTKFKLLSEEFVSIAATAIAAKTTPVDKVMAYNSFYRLAPNELTKQLIAPTLTGTASQLFIKRFGDYSAYNSTNSIMLRELRSSSAKSVDLSKHYVNLSTFCKSKFLLVDVTKNFLEIAKKLARDENTIVTIVSRPIGTKLEDFLPIAEAFVKELGITNYVKASDHVIHIVKTAATRAAGIRVCGFGLDINNTVFGNKPTSTRQDYWYLPVSGSTVETDDFKSIVDAYKLLPNPKPNFVGVQKKYRDDVLTAPNFLPAIPAIQAALNAITFTVASQEYLSTYLRCPKEPALAPADIKLFMSEYLVKQAVVNARLYKYDTQISSASTSFKVNSIVSKFTVSYETLCAKYPLLHVLQGPYGSNHRSQAQFDHYMKLEYINEQRNLSGDER